MKLVKPIILTIPLIFELGSMSEPKKRWASVYPKKVAKVAIRLTGEKSS